jgi:phosphoglycerate-specific signal transduction histidine kinase
MQMFNQRMGQIVRVSGGLILVATLLALLLAWVLNHYFIRSRLVKRFTALNQAVVQIGLAERMPPFRYMDAMNWGVLPVCFAIRWVS